MTLLHRLRTLEDDLRTRQVKLGLGIAVDLVGEEGQRRGMDSCLFSFTILWEI